jgi:hypothetical protein
MLIGQRFNQNQTFFFEDGKQRFLQHDRFKFRQGRSETNYNGD